MTTADVAFPGFGPAAFGFLKELSDHNDPDWFRPRKAVYDTQVLSPLRHLVVAVGAALEEAGLPLVGDPQRGIFRIYRDVRFSPDKASGIPSRCTSPACGAPSSTTPTAFWRFPRSSPPPALLSPATRG